MWYLFSKIPVSEIVKYINNCDDVISKFYQTYPQAVYLIG